MNKKEKTILWYILLYTDDWSIPTQVTKTNEYLKGDLRPEENKERGELKRIITIIELRIREGQEAEKTLNKETHPRILI